MSLGSIHDLSGYPPSALGTVQKSTDTRVVREPPVHPLNAADPFVELDESRVSRFGQVLNTFQHLQQSAPTQYREVAQQIATNLQSAAQTAQSDGQTTAANQLIQLATDFTNASKSGQLPNIQHLAQVIGGHHRDHHFHSIPPDAGSESSAGSSSELLRQRLSAFPTGRIQDDSLNPMAIILSTLSDSGISSSEA